MKTMITCDGVFEILTRAPFPAGHEDDAQVELHLAACHECRQLAEALRPAVGLFHEALEDESESLPSYVGGLGSVAPRLVSQHAGRDSVRWLTLVAAAACVLCAAVFVRGRDRVPAVVAVQPSGGQGISSWITLLDDLQLPAACRPKPTAELAVRLSQACCTRCHHAESEIATAPQAVAKSAAACLICHDDRQASLPIDYHALRSLRDFLVPSNGQNLWVLTLRLVRDDNRSKFAVRVGSQLSTGPIHWGTHARTRPVAPRGKFAATQLTGDRSGFFGNCQVGRSTTPNQAAKQHLQDIAALHSEPVKISCGCGVLAAVPRRTRLA